MSESAKSVKSNGKYFLYQVKGCANLFELYFGEKGTEFSASVGHVSEVEAFEYGVECAEEELRILSAQAEKEFGGK